MRFLSIAFVPFLLGACLVAVSPASFASGVFDRHSVMVENARLSDAEEMLQQWLAVHPEDQEARFLLARILMWQEKNAEALVQYQWLLESEPDNGDYLSGRAMLSGAVNPESAKVPEQPAVASSPR